MYDKLIEDGLQKLGRKDLSSKVKVKQLDYYTLINPYTVDHAIAYVISAPSRTCDLTGFIEKIPYPDSVHYLDNTIYLSKIFQSIRYDNVKEVVLLHELCHVVDCNQENDQTIENGGHGKTWAELMMKLDLKPVVNLGHSIPGMTIEEMIEWPLKNKYRYHIIDRERDLFRANLVEIVN